MAILIFNVPARTMKRERFALAGVPLLTRKTLVCRIGLLNDVIFIAYACSSYINRSEKAVAGVSCRLPQIHWYGEVHLAPRHVCPSPQPLCATATHCVRRPFFILITNE